MKKKNILITGYIELFGSSIIKYLSNKNYRFFLLHSKNSNIIRHNTNKYHKFIFIDYYRNENFFKSL